MHRSYRAELSTYPRVAAKLKAHNHFAAVDCKRILNNTQHSAKMHSTDIVTLLVNVTNDRNVSEFNDDTATDSPLRFAFHHQLWSDTITTDHLSELRAIASPSAAIDYNKTSYQVVAVDLNKTSEEATPAIYSLSATVVLGAVIALLAVVTIAGNLLVIASFATDRKLRSFGNYFILNLAISDLIVGLLICVYAPYLLQASDVTGVSVYSE